MASQTLFFPRGWMDSAALQEPCNRPAANSTAWLWLIENAAWRDGLTRQVKRTSVPVAIGDVAVSIREMAACWRWQEVRVRGFLVRLEAAGMVTVGEYGDLPLCRITITGYAENHWVKGTPYNAPFPPFHASPSHGCHPGVGRRTGFTPDVRKRVLAKTQGCCFYCEGALHDDPAPGRFHVDHKRPIRNGGTDNFGNLVPSCPTCNLSKGAKSVAAWRRV